MKTNLCLLWAVAIAAAVSNPVYTTKAGPENVPVTAESLRKGLVLHLTCNQDATGTQVVADSSGLGNHGRASGVRWTADGKLGGAFEFTADGNEIVVSNHVSLNPKQFSLAAWIKTSSKSGKWMRIFDKSYSRGYALSIAADWQKNNWSGLANLEIGPGTHSSLSRRIVADGQWHHLVATFDGTEQLLFVDGRPEGWPLRWDQSGQPGVTDFNLVIGCNRSNVGADDLGVSFRGFIDEPMMWSRALSLKEVAFLYESQRGAKPEVNVPEPNTITSGTIHPLLKGIVHFTDNDIRFHTATGTNVFVDPVSWPTDDAVIQSGMLKPDLILITHSHSDHFQPTIIQEYLCLNPRAILAGPPDVVKTLQSKGTNAREATPGHTYTFAGIPLHTIPAYFKQGDSHPKANQWIGYVLQLGTTSYYVTGDTEVLPEMSQSKVDVLFPLLFGCGGNIEQALKMSELTKAHLVVPVHTDGQVEIIKKYLGRLPKGVQGAYYLDAKVINP